jgi:hypothetical protein
VKKSTLPSIDSVRTELAEAVRAGCMFIEGDLINTAFRPYAVTFLKGDDLDMNPDSVVPLKKTLLRTERFCTLHCSSVLWRKRPDMADRIEPILYGSIASPLAIDKVSNWGYKPLEMSMDFKKVFKLRKSVWLMNRLAEDKLSILLNRGYYCKVKGAKYICIARYISPVSDSMDDVVGALELFTVILPSNKKACLKSLA